MQDECAIEGLSPWWKEARSESGYIVVGWNIGSKVKLVYPYTYAQLTRNVGIELYLIPSFSRDWRQIHQLKFLTFPEASMLEAERPLSPITAFPDPPSPPLNGNA